jgi:decaprenylphospho-beta-D-erythro-pentofuranosid-2-ulose 2-reductase
VQDAFGDPGTVALFGATSDIGQAIVRRVVHRRDAQVVLAARDPAAVEDFAGALRDRGARTHVLAFEATDVDHHDELVRDIVAEVGDLDLAIVAFGVLGHGQGVDTDPAAAARQVSVNYTGAVSLGLALAAQLRRQGHGTIVVLSSVAGERVRKANFVYGSAKAGLDGFAQGLSDALAGTGVRVLIVRPGFVVSRMTEGLRPAPFATTPERVAEVVERGLRRGRRVVWAPPILRPIFVVFRHLPSGVWRRLPF